jgi:hypothetical protein
MLPLAVDEYCSAVRGFDKTETEWLKRATLRMIGNVGIELLTGRESPRQPAGRITPAARL